MTNVDLAHNTEQDLTDAFPLVGFFAFISDDEVIMDLKAVDSRCRSSGINAIIDTATAGL